jgi:hypothetical protein
MALFRDLVVAVALASSRKEVNGRASCTGGSPPLRSASVRRYSAVAIAALAASRLRQ